MLLEAPEELTYRDLRRQPEPVEGLEMFDDFVGAEFLINEVLLCNTNCTIS
jgi:hypothetical protein